MVYIRIKDAGGGYDLPHMDKEEVHRRMQRQFRRTGSVGSVKLKDCHTKGIIIDRDGYMTLQRRPASARDNGGLIDTSWGSHIEACDTTTTSAMYESARELNIATTVVPDEHFFNILENHPDITSELAITRRAAYLRNFVSERRMRSGRSWQEPCELTFFVSYFDGKFRSTPKQRAGVAYYTIDALAEDIAANPGMFTSDLIEIARRYPDLLVPYRQLEGFSPNPDPRASELVQEFDLRGNPLEPKPRKQVHKNMMRAFLRGSSPKVKHRHVRVMLMRPDGTFYLQQRAEGKKENPGLIDKPVGGHVGLGDTYDTAVLHECNDELAIAAAVLPEEDFMTIARERPEILEHQAVLVRVATLENYVSRDRIILGRGKKSWDETNDSAFYLGVYSGPIKLKDGEATGVEVKSMRDLKRQLRKNPGRYTRDLIDMVEMVAESNVARSLRLAA